MLEAQTLHDVVQLDVDGEVLGVELQLVVGPQPAVRIDDHLDGRHVTVDRHAPVAPRCRVDGERNRDRSPWHSIHVRIL